MIVLVSDTSILIDLERGGLLEAAFACGFTMVVPDLLYENELEPENGAYLRSLGLGVVSLTPDELASAQKFKTARKALSLPDCFALSCASRPNHALVTGDKNLRTAAVETLGQVYGLPRAEVALEDATSEFSESMPSQQPWPCSHNPRRSDAGCRCSTRA